MYIDKHFPMKRKLHEKGKTWIQQKTKAKKESFPLIIPCIECWFAKWFNQSLKYTLEIQAIL